MFTNARGAVRHGVAASVLAFVGLGLGVGLVLSGPAAAADAGRVTVGVAVIGTEPRAADYDLSIECSTKAGVLRTPKVALRIGAGRTQTVAPADVPGLDPEDTCIVRATGVDGSELSYATTVAARADGSKPEPLRGVVDASGYHAAPVTASGQSVTMTVTFVGDLLVRKVVEGASATEVGLYEIQVHCSGVGISRTVLLGDGQSTLLTGIPTGSSCTVDEARGDGAAPRFDDNVGDAHDGRVNIVATPAACWDLRATGADCRAVVTVTNRFRPTVVDLTRPRVEEPTTTIAEDQQNRQNPATTAAPAVVAQPAQAVESTPTFTG
jgi:Domain of unknown function (DUF5979)